jgi:hypothetical protein
VDSVYRVRSVASDMVTLIYTPLGIEQHLTYIPGASRPAAAQPSLHTAVVTPPARHNPRAKGWFDKAKEFFEG